MKRFTRKHPCPICGGWASQARGRSVRCWGYLSKDGRYAHCTRDEWARSIQLTEKSDTYAHNLLGRCNCGKHHDQADKEAAAKIVKTYSYRDAEGEELHQLVRYGDKQFLQRRRVNGKWVWNLEGVPRVLYRLPQLLAAKAKRTVFAVEGEKDANNLARLGLVTTTNPGGAGKWKDEYSQPLIGRNVVILPDNDQVGRDHAKQVAQSLIGLAKSVKILQLPNLPPHGDVSTWLKKGGTKDKLVKLVSEAKVFSGPGADRTEFPFRTAADLSAVAANTVEWIAPFVAAGAITDAIGKVKVAGKTTFFTHLAAAVVRGKEFLGVKTTRTPVVYLTEQAHASFFQALNRAGLVGHPDFVFLSWTEVMGKPWPDVADAAVRECKKRGAKLLVVDTIAPFAGLSGATENDSGHALEAMKPLQIATAAGIGVVIIQHERKGGGELGEAGRGSTAFAGAADILLSISRRKGANQNNLREIHSISRFGEEPPMLVELTDNGYVSHGNVRPIATERASALILEAIPALKKDVSFFFNDWINS